ncbi:MAG: hypothetical protein ACM3N0_06705 [Chloroflexota bacterium]
MGTDDPRLARAIFTLRETAGYLDVPKRGLGIPGLKLSGSPLSFNVVPFRVLDSDSHTVKPRRGQIKDAVNAWWAMTTQTSQ